MVEWYYQRKGGESNETLADHCFDRGSIVAHGADLGMLPPLAKLAHLVSGRDDGLNGAPHLGHRRHADLGALPLPPQIIRLYSNRLMGPFRCKPKRTRFPYSRPASMPLHSATAPLSLFSSFRLDTLTDIAKRGAWR